jgi:hypothetical protein
MKFAQVLVCVAAVCLSWSCASSSHSPQASSGHAAHMPDPWDTNPHLDEAVRTGSSDVIFKPNQ